MTSTLLSGLVFVTSVVVAVTPEIVPVYWPHPCYDIFFFCFVTYRIALSLFFCFNAALSGY